MKKPQGVMTFDEGKHEYRLDGRVLPSVTQIIREAGLSREYGPEAEFARERGTAVHALTHYYDEGDVGEFDPQLQPYLDAWIRFREEHGFQPELIEVRTWHPIYRYAGTIDRIGRRKDGKRWLIEIKAGSPERSHCLQTSAYVEAYQQHDNRRLLRAAVYLRSDGRPDFRIHEKETDRAVFLAALAVRNWKKEAA